MAILMGCRVYLFSGIQSDAQVRRMSENCVRPFALQDILCIKFQSHKHIQLLYIILQCEGGFIDHPVWAHDRKMPGALEFLAHHQTACLSRE